MSRGKDNETNQHNVDVHIHHSSKLMRRPLFEPLVTEGGGAILRWRSSDRFSDFIQQIEQQFFGGSHAGGAERGAGSPTSSRRNGAFNQPGVIGRDGRATCPKTGSRKRLRNDAEMFHVQMFTGDRENRR